MYKKCVDELMDKKISMENNLGKYLEKEKKSLKKKRKKIEKLQEKILILEARLLSTGAIKIIKNEQRFNTQDSKIIKWLHAKEYCIIAKNILEATENNLKYEIINIHIPINYHNYNRKEALYIKKIQDVKILYFVYNYTVSNIAKYHENSIGYIHQQIQKIGIKNKFN